MTSRTGLLFNWSLALGAYAIGGPLWATIAFLGVALIRVTLELQALRRNHTELKRVVATRGAAFGLSEFVNTPEAEMPASEVRPLRILTEAMPSFREKLASFGGS